MFSIIRSRVVALPGVTSTRFIQALPYRRGFTSAQLRAFSKSSIAREGEEGERSYGFSSNGRDRDSGERRPYGQDKESEADRFPYGQPREQNGAGSGGRRGGHDEKYDNSRQAAVNRQRRQNPPSSTLYVGNLPYSTQEDRLKDLFSEYGTVISVRIGMDPATGQSRGFAHVDFVDLTTAQSVIDANDEAEFYLEGRQLKFDFAAGPVRRGTSNAPREKFPPSNTLYIQNFYGDEAQLAKELKEYENTITDLNLWRDPEGRSRGFGFVEFLSVEDATAVLEKLNGKPMESGSIFTLAYSRGRKQGPR